MYLANIEKKLNVKSGSLFLLQKDVLKLVFSDKKYIALSILIFIGLLIGLSIVSQFIFLSPQVMFYVSEDSMLRFSLIIIVSALSGLVISMSIYRIRQLQENVKNSSVGFFGSIIGASAGACSCGSIGFAVASTFGTAGTTATAFLTNYEIPLRLAAIGILAFTYYMTVKRLTTECKIQK